MKTLIILTVFSGLILCGSAAAVGTCASRDTAYNNLVGKGMPGKMWPRGASVNVTVLQYGPGNGSCMYKFYNWSDYNKLLFKFCVSPPSLSGNVFYSNATNSFYFGNIPAGWVVISGGAYPTVLKNMNSPYKMAAIQCD